MQRHKRTAEIDLWAFEQPCETKISHTHTHTHSHVSIPWTHALPMIHAQQSLTTGAVAHITGRCDKRTAHTQPSVTHPHIQHTQLSVCLHRCTAAFAHQRFTSVNTFNKQTQTDAPQTVSKALPGCCNACSPSTDTHKGAYSSQGAGPSQRGGCASMRTTASPTSALTHEGHKGRQLLVPRDHNTLTA